MNSRSWKLLFLFAVFGLTIFGEAIRADDAPAKAETGAPAGGEKEDPGKAVEARDDSEDGKLLLRFFNAPVSALLNVYEKLVEKPVARDDSLSEGPVITLVNPTGVDRRGALSLIESALLVNGYVLEESGENGLAARFVPSRKEGWKLSLPGDAPVEAAEQTIRDEKSRKGPPKEVIEKYQALSPEKKERFREFIRQTMENFPDLDREERGKRIQQFLDELAEPGGTPSEPGTPNSPSGSGKPAEPAPR